MRELSCAGPPWPAFSLTALARAFIKRYDLECQRSAAVLRVKELAKTVAKNAAAASSSSSSVEPVMADDDEETDAAAQLADLEALVKPLPLLKP